MIKKIIVIIALVINICCYTCAALGNTIEFHEINGRCEVGHGTQAFAYKFRQVYNARNGHNTKKCVLKILVLIYF